MLQSLSISTSPIIEVFRNTWRTDALVVRVPSLVDACGPVLAGVFRARVILELASDPGVGGWAGAVEARPEVLALGAVHAGLAHAALGGGLAVLAVCALGTTGRGEMGLDKQCTTSTENSSQLNNPPKQGP